MIIFNNGTVVNLGGKYGAAVLKLFLITLNKRKINNFMMENNEISLIPVVVTAPLGQN